MEFLTDELLQKQRIFFFNQIYMDEVIMMHIIVMYMIVMIQEMTTIYRMIIMKCEVNLDLHLVSINMHYSILYLYFIHVIIHYCYYLYYY